MTPADSQPVAVRDAATVVLLRDGTGGASGIEAWLLTRVAGMTFAAGMSVFPGGRIEAADALLPMADAEVAALAARFGCPDEAARAAVGAAVRETFEETGVLLSAPAAAADLDLAVARGEVEAGRLSFGQLLTTHQLSVDAGALRPWARWVTPAGEVRRYDTRFFVGALPAGAEARDVTTESSEASWVPVATALEQAQLGLRKLMPPTLVTLTALAGYPDVASVLAAADGRSLEPVCPVLRIDDDGAVTVSLPDGSVYPIPRSLLA